MIKHGADGYYLFIYSSISAIENVVKFSPRHDHNMSLWEKKHNRVSLMRHWEFERITGMKHHMISFFSVEEARHFINTLLCEFNLTLDDINDIIGTPGLSNKGYLTNWNHPDSVTYHALCHLYSGLLMDSEKFFNDNILAISIDGGSDSVIERDAWGKNMFAAAICQKGKIRFTRFPVSARLWSQASQINNMAEGSLMALATAVIDKSFDIAPYLAELRKIDIYNTVQVDRLYDKLEIIAKDQTLLKTDKSGNMDQFSSSDIYLSTLMKAIQFLSIEMTKIGIRHILKQFKIKSSDYYLSISGGYSLNCPNNTEMMRTFSFKGQLIPPCGNDSGQSIGMALEYFYNCLPYFNFKLKNAYFGGRYDLKGFHSIGQYNSFILSTEQGLDKVVQDIINGPIIWFDGRSEIGPRALGHRSLIADPRNAYSKDLLNKYKKRQWWRPVAPIVLESHLYEWFKDAFPSPFMLNNFVVRRELADQVPAVLHIDNTARVQTVTQKDAGLYELLIRFYKETTIPILCNTSLNHKGEPIVENIEQAFQFALNNGISILYINGWRYEIAVDHHNCKECILDRELKPYFEKHKKEDVSFYQGNPYGVTKIEYIFSRVHPRYRISSLYSKEEILQMKRAYQIARQQNANIDNELLSFFSIK